MTDPAARLSIAAADRQLTLAGEVDAFTAPLLSEHLEQLGTDADVHLHLGDVTFMDSSGLRVVMGAHRTLDAAGRVLHLQQPSPAVAKLLEITGLTDHLQLEQDDRRTVSTPTDPASE